MPLLNMMVMCGDVSPIILSIWDFNDHISECEKKNATYIAEMFEEKVNEIDPKGRSTDVFFFDGTFNVQKAGQMCVKLFQGHCSHGGKHVMSHSFSDQSKLKPIQVRNVLVLFSMMPC